MISLVGHAALFLAMRDSSVDGEKLQWDLKLLLNAIQRMLLCSYKNKRSRVDS